MDGLFTLVGNILLFACTFADCVRPQADFVVWHNSHQQLDNVASDFQRTRVMLTENMLGSERQSEVSQNESHDVNPPASEDANESHDESSQKSQGVAEEYSLEKDAPRWYRARKKLAVAKVPGEHNYIVMSPEHNDVNHAEGTAHDEGDIHEAHGNSDGKGEKATKKEKATKEEKATKKKKGPKVHSLTSPAWLWEKTHTKDLGKYAASMKKRFEKRAKDIRPDQRSTLDNRRGHANPDEKISANKASSGEDEVHHTFSAEDSAAQENKENHASPPTVHAHGSAKHLESDPENEAQDSIAQDKRGTEESSPAIHAYGSSKSDIENEALARQAEPRLASQAENDQHKHDAKEELPSVSTDPEVWIKKEADSEAKGGPPAKKPTQTSQSAPDAEAHDTTTAKNRRPNEPDLGDHPSATSPSRNGASTAPAARKELEPRGGEAHSWGESEAMAKLDQASLGRKNSDHPESPAVQGLKSKGKGKVDDDVKVISTREPGDRDAGNRDSKLPAGADSISASPVAKESSVASTKGDHPDTTSPTRNGANTASAARNELEPRGTEAHSRESDVATVDRTSPARKNSDHPESSAEQESNSKGEGILDEDVKAISTSEPRERNGGHIDSELSARTDSHSASPALKEANPQAIGTLNDLERAFSKSRPRGPGLGDGHSKLPSKRESTTEGITNSDENAEANPILKKHTQGHAHQNDGEMQAHGSSSEDILGREESIGEATVESDGDFEDKPTNSRKKHGDHLKSLPTKSEIAVEPTDPSTKLASLPRREPPHVDSPSTGRHASPRRQQHLHSILPARVEVTRNPKANNETDVSENPAIKHNVASQPDEVEDEILKLAESSERPIAAAKRGAADSRAAATSRYSNDSDALTSADEAPQSRHLKPSAPKQMATLDGDVDRDLERIASASEDLGAPTLSPSTDASDDKAAHVQGIPYEENTPIPTTTVPTYNVLTYNLCLGCVQKNSQDRDGAQAMHIGHAIAKYHKSVAGGYDFIAFQEAPNVSDLRLESKGVALRMVEYGSQLPTQKHIETHEGRLKRPWVVTLYNETRLGPHDLAVAGSDDHDPARLFLILFFDKAHLMFINFCNGRGRQHGLDSFLDYMAGKLSSAFYEKRARRSYRVIFAGDFGDRKGRLPGKLSLPWRRGVVLQLAGPPAHSCCQANQKHQHTETSDYIFDSESTGSNHIPEAYKSEKPQSDHAPVEAILGLSVRP